MGLLCVLNSLSFLIPLLHHVKQKEKELTQLGKLQEIPLECYVCPMLESVSMILN